MYYSGLDVVVSGYVAKQDKFLPFDCNSIQFSWDNPKSPIYGHSHNIMSTKMQGTSLVNGVFSLNLSKPQAIKSGIGDKYADTGFYFDIDIKPYKLEGGTKVPVVFEEAFAEAREVVGPGKSFRWNGKTYSTSTAEETTGASNVSWGQFQHGDNLDLKIDLTNSTKQGTTEAELMMRGTDNPKYRGVDNYTGFWIRGVEITSRSQTINPSPENILDSYHFIARNIHSF